MRNWVLAILACAGVASADARRDAEQLAKDKKYVACGQAYLDLFNRDPQGGDELLYNAAVCFEQGASVSVAILTYAQLMRVFPTSKLVPKALARSAKLYDRIARYDDAAARYEEYAAKYAGEKDARDALEDAIALRTAIGDSDQRVRDTQLFIKMFGAKAPKQAAAASFALVAAYAAPADQIKQLRSYLAQFGGKDEERTILAYAKLGELFWAQSCSVPLVDGLCVKVVRLPASPQHCGASEQVRVVVVKRGAARKEALAAYQQAAARFDKSPQTPSTLWAAGMAKLALADDDLERMLEAGVPGNLDFDPTHAQHHKQSQKRFNDWITKQTQLGTSLRQRYEEVAARKDAVTSLAATLRLGQVAQAFARALTIAEIPKDVRTGNFVKEKVKLFCDALRDHAEPLEAKAVEAFAVCMQKAGELGVDDVYTRACRREAQALAPAEFPPRELVAEPALPSLAPVLEAAPPGSQLAPATSEPACRQAAERFAQQARKLGKGGADALYTAGLSYHRCGLVADARRAYEGALTLAPDHARAASNLGELAWRSSQRDAAVKAWQDALVRDGKLFGAHFGLALAGYDQLRSLPAGDRNRKTVAADIALHASSALALDVADPSPLVVLALVAIEERKLALAKFLVEQALRFDDAFTPALQARAVLAIRRDGWTAGAADLDRAAALAPASEPVQLAAGLAALRVGRYEEASKRLALVKTPSYDLFVARGAAARAMLKHDAAESAYEQAIKQDPARAEAHYNLALLYAGYRANSVSDPKARLQVLNNAIEHYRRAAALDPKLDAAARADALAKQIASP